MHDSLNLQQPQSRRCPSRTRRADKTSNVEKKRGNDSVAADALMNMQPSFFDSTICAPTNVVPWKAANTSVVAGYSEYPNAVTCCIRCFCRVLGANHYNICVQGSVRYKSDLHRQNILSDVPSAIAPSCASSSATDFRSSHAAIQSCVTRSSSADELAQCYTRIVRAQVPRKRPAFSAHLHCAHTWVLRGAYNPRAPRSHPYPTHELQAQENVKLARASHRGMHMHGWSNSECTSS
jgi:hypothetical protein